MSAVERGARLRATLTDRTYRVLSVNAETDTARVLAPRDGECRSFRAPVDRIQDDIDAGRIEVLPA
ncbi:hypothetical protein BRC68_15820 [Halobacteriales archaeon QH_6_64_20]|nr:MAG: hypothetical protein BRC68_15820 [Halobacteriales archaeon QH_6_64_20]